MAVNDNNPLYGSFSYSAVISLLQRTGGDQPSQRHTYWADFLFGTTKRLLPCQLLRGPPHARTPTTSTPRTTGRSSQPDPQPRPPLGVRLALLRPLQQHLQLRSHHPDRPHHQPRSRRHPRSHHPGKLRRNLRQDPGQPRLHRLRPTRVGFSYAAGPKTDIRGGFGISYAHYTRAGSGDILSINAPQAQFASVTQTAPSATNPHCASPLPAQIIAPGATTPSCFATADQGYPSGLVTSFNKATDNITYIPRNTKDSYVESYFLSVQQTLFKNALLDIAYVGNHGVKLQGFLNANQKNPSLGFARPYSNWPSDITEALNEFYSHYDSLQVKYEQRFVGGLTLLNSFTWGHSLDNASASLEGNTPSPQDANNIRADYAQSDYNLPVANITSLVYELPFGHGRKFMSSANGIVDGVLGGWQVSSINSMTAGTPFNITYSPNSAQALSPQISATYRGANEYRPNRVPGQPITQGRSSRQANTGYVNYVNLAAFVLPPIKDASGNVLSPFGNASRNPGRSPAFYQTDLSLNKRFQTPIEGMKVEFRTEFYNILNHTNLYLPGGISGTQGTTAQTVGAGGTVALGNILGGVPSANTGQITSTFEPRIIQFGLKILY